MDWITQSFSRYLYYIRRFRVDDKTIEIEVMSDFCFFSILRIAQQLEDDREILLTNRNKA